MGVGYLVWGFCLCSLTFIFIKSQAIDCCFSWVLFVLIGYACEFALVHSSVHLAIVHLKLPGKAI